jgi:uncharacterized protein with HEPN domain
MSSMPSRDPILRYTEIVREIELIRRFVAERSAADVAADIMAVRAIERSLGIISEAAVKLGDMAEQTIPGQPWRKIRGLGNVLRHAYDDVAFEALWHTIENDLDSLHDDCSNQIAHSGRGK